MSGLEKAAEYIRDEICNFSNVEPSIPWLKEMLAKMPTFQFTKKQWIKTSERLPDGDFPIWYWRDGLHKVFEGYGRMACIREYTHWMPREVPNLPQEEESPCVKEILAMQIPNEDFDIVSHHLKRAVEIVKKYQKGSK
jgi:hypothetical protein